MVLLLTKSTKSKPYICSRKCGWKNESIWGPKQMKITRCHYSPFIHSSLYKQNCRIWGKEKPHAYIKKPTHLKRVTLWYGFWSRGIIGTFFFENEQGRPLQSMAIVIGPFERIFVHKNWIGGYWQHLVWTGRLYVPHSRSYTQCFAPCFWRSYYQPQSKCRFATSKLWSDKWHWMKLFIFHY